MRPESNGSFLSLLSPGAAPALPCVASTAWRAFLVPNALVLVIASALRDASWHAAPRLVLTTSSKSITARFGRICAKELRCGTLREPLHESSRCFT